METNLSSQRSIVHSIHWIFLGAAALAVLTAAAPRSQTASFEGATNVV